MPETCGCQSAPRRHCDVCYAEARVFLACSRSCLDAHQLQHGALTSAEQRAKSLLAQINASHPDSSTVFAPHRERLMGLAVIAAASHGTSVARLAAAAASLTSREPRDKSQPHARPPVARVCKKYACTAPALRR